MNIIARSITRQRLTRQLVTKRQYSISDQFKKLGKEYGRAGLFVYLAMSTTTFSILYVAIWNGVDVEKVILSRIREAKKTAEIITPEEAKKDEQKEETEFERQDLPADEASVDKADISLERIGTTFLVAFAANKLLSPIKAMLAVFLTPSIVKWLRRR